MSRFLLGDELGNIKSVQSSFSKATPTVKTILKAEQSSSSVQALSIAQVEGRSIVAAGFSNGRANAYSLEDDELKILHSWKETRLPSGQSYLGIAATEKGIVSCTTNGALRLTTLPEDDGESSNQLGGLPSRLQAWSISPDHRTFAYGGFEVDLSLWDTEKAFQGPATTASPTAESGAGKKRKRDTFFPGEIWRARNVQPDNLGLRQPIRISCLAYLTQTPSHAQICTGTEFGDVRRYDTRAARKPVTDWKLSKVNGIKSIQKGEAEHELFISDTGSNLQAIDLRTGGIIYGYKGISGSVGSMASSPQGLASVASDRFIRFHTTVPPPAKIGQQQPSKGEVVEKVFVNALPTVITWDLSSGHDIPSAGAASNSDDEEKGDEEDDVWETMQKVDSDHEDDLPRKKRH